MADHRDFKRDRETHRDRDRDRGVIDYDRDRFDRERRPRDDRYVMKNIFLPGVQIIIDLSSAKVIVSKGNSVNDVFFLYIHMYNLERYEQFQTMYVVSLNLVSLNSRELNGRWR